MSSQALKDALTRGDETTVRTLITSNPSYANDEIIRAAGFLWTPLEFVCYDNVKNDNASLVALLIELGANVNKQDIYYRYTPAHYGAENGKRLHD